MKTKSLRQLARELGVSASYMSQVRNGKRPASQRVLSSLSTGVKQSVKQNLAGANGSRTHRGYGTVPPNGFEVREAHRDPTAPSKFSIHDMLASHNDWDLCP